MYCIVNAQTPISTWENLDDALLNIIALSKFTQPEQFDNSSWSIVDNYFAGCNLDELPRVTISSQVKCCSHCGLLYPLSCFVGARKSHRVTKECKACRQDRAVRHGGFAKSKPQGWKPFRMMTIEEKRQYFKDRGFTTKRPGRDTPKVVPVKEPSAIEKRYMENGVNMFRWSLWYYDLTSTPVVDKMIWDLECPSKVQCKHEGVVADKGWRFIVYATSKEKAIEKVQQYISKMAA